MRVSPWLETFDSAKFSGRRDYQFRGAHGVLKRGSNEPGSWELYTRNRRETYETAALDGGHGGSDVLQMRDYLRCVRERAPPRATVSDAKRAAAVALAAERSIADGGEIDSKYELHR